LTRVNSAVNISSVTNIRTTDYPECANLVVQTQDQREGYLTSRNPLILCDQDTQSRGSSAHSKKQQDRDKSCVPKTKCSFTKLKIIKRQSSSEESLSGENFGSA
jgi:hypothetical protein